MKYKTEITKDQRANDLANEFDSLTDAIIYISQNANADDGYRIIGYEDKSGSLREGSFILLRCHCELTDTENTYETESEADTAISNLDDSDGYEKIDLEQPLGSAPSLVIDCRPSLWQRHHEEYEASRPNNHSRVDTDRF